LSAEQRAGKVALFLGKNLLSQFGLAGQGERLTIRSGEDISETGKPTYHVEYKLSSRWYLVGEYDQFNAFNAGLRWKIYSK
jgi:translocation and assembly module TamB